MTLDTHASQRWEKGTLLVGFWALAVAVLLAHRSPPEAYELSIYTGTPTEFWVGSAVALVVAMVVGLRAVGGIRTLALGLGGATMLVVVSLPVVRSYYFYGAGDSLTHLGWAKDIAVGNLSVLDLLYPGTHAIAVFIADVTGMALPRAVLVMVMTFFAVFLLFVPLTTWAITHDRRATTLAAFSGLLFLPLNNVSVFDMAHPTTQAIAFLPLLLYLSARQLTRADRDTFLVGSPSGALLALGSVAVVLVHPQQAANVLLVFGAIFGIQLLARLVSYATEIDSEATGHRLFAFQTVFLAGVFFLWAPRHERATGATSALVNMLQNGPQVGADVAQRSVSLSAVGGSIEVLFLKLFLVSLVFCGLAGLLVLGGFLGRLGSQQNTPDTTAFSQYFGLALVPLFGLFGAYFLVSYEQLHFRQLGFIMVLVTILGAIALSKGVAVLSTHLSPGSSKAVVGVAVVVMLALSIPTVYQSPYIYQSSGHVTEAQFTGYETAIEHQGSAPFIGIRGSGERWTDAILGVEESRERPLTYGSFYANDRHPAIGDNFRGDYVARHYENRYLAVTDRDYQRDVQLFDGFRFDETGFRSLDATPQINRVQANGDFQLYQINATADGGN